MSPHARTGFTPRTKALSIRGLNHYVAQHQVWFNLAVLAILFTLSFTYIVQVNQSISQGYRIRALETEIQNLTLTNDRLEEAHQKGRALDRVSRNVDMLGLVPAETTTYMNATDASYALAD